MIWIQFRSEEVYEHVLVQYTQVEAVCTPLRSAAFQSSSYQPI